MIYTEFGLPYTRYIYIFIYLYFKQRCKLDNIISSLLTNNKFRLCAMKAKGTVRCGWAAGHHSPQQYTILWST